MNEIENIKIEKGAAKKWGYFRFSCGWINDWGNDSKSWFVMNQKQNIWCYPNGYKGQFSISSSLCGISYNRHIISYNRGKMRVLYQMILLFLHP